MEIMFNQDDNRGNGSSLRLEPLDESGKVWFAIGSTSEWGEIIDLSEVAKASRGQTTTYEDGLLDALEKAFTSGGALAIAKFAVVASEFKTDEDYKNAKQSNSAEIRKHVTQLVRVGRIAEGSKATINWHPETGVPQVSLRTS